MKTAMQEFSDWLKAYEYELPLELQVKAKEAIEKEKEQIENTFADGFVEGVETQKSGEQLLFPEQYYNQTYNQNK
jgi:flagellar biosynthesis/type III secretory pathway protein FliH